MPRTPATLKDTLKNLGGLFAWLAALGMIALLWMAVVQAAAIGIAIVVGISVAAFQGMGPGFLAGILTYAAEMKLLQYLEIYDMITANRKPKRRQKTTTAESS